MRSLTPEAHVKKRDLQQPNALRMIPSALAVNARALAAFDSFFKVLLIPGLSSVRLVQAPAQSMPKCASIRVSLSISVYLTLFELEAQNFTNEYIHKIIHG